MDANLTVAEPQIRSVDIDGVVTTFSDNVGTRDAASVLEIRGAGAIGGGTINIAGDVNEGLDVAKQSTQCFTSLGGIGFNSPSLLGLAYHSPFLHDGSAITLDEVFNVHTLPASGETIAAEINDNVALEKADSIQAYYAKILDPKLETRGATSAQKFYRGDLTSANIKTEAKRELLKSAIIHIGSAGWTSQLDNSKI